MTACECRENLVRSSEGNATFKCGLLRLANGNLSWSRYLSIVLAAIGWFPTRVSRYGSVNQPFIYASLAVTKPLLKKPGLDCQFKNFRPVSNLPFTSKLTERAVFEQIQKHMCTNNLYPPYQSSCRRYFSTETSLLRVKNDILLNMNKQHLTLLILLDLSSAFDTVDHDILLKRLSSKFAVSGTVIEWLRSYLDERCQRILINTTQSSSFNCVNFFGPLRDRRNK